MRFAKLVELYEQLKQTSSNNAMRDLCATFFKKLSPKEVKIASYLTLGSIGPADADTDLGIAEKMAVKAVADAEKIDVVKVKQLLGKTGDLGDVIRKIHKGKGGSLSIEAVHTALCNVRQARGAGSQEQKRKILSRLVHNASAKEAKYIMRIAVGKLRLGVGDATLLDAFALAFTGDLNNRTAIRQRYHVQTDIGAIGEALASKGLKAVKQSAVTITKPVLLMLAQRVKDVSEILAKMPTEIAAEEKYDGERVQIHKDGNTVILFSRRLENISAQYPEIVESTKHITAKQAVLDGEIVALKDGKVQPFQLLMQRRRKYAVEEYRKKIPVVVMLFDALSINKKSLLKVPYPERRRHLEKIVKERGALRLAKRKVSGNFSEIRKFFEDCVKRGLEGIIAKSTAPDSHYQPGKRGWKWIKWKKEYAKGMQESFDLVVIGSYFGKGQRKGTFGALLCAAWNTKTKRFETFTKVGTGFTEADFRSLGKQLSKYKVSAQPRNVTVTKTMLPDLWYQPKMVIEVIGAEITTSPNHTAGKDGRQRGLALRFPRYIRLRDDKGPQQATTVKEIEELK